MTVICLTLYLPVQLPKNVLIDPAFTPFVKAFVAEGEKRGFSIRSKLTAIQIAFGTLPQNKAGSCKKRKITINPEMWNRMDSLQRQALIFHELGHCALGRRHKDSTLPRGECASIMIESANVNSCYYNFFSEKWRNYYLDELFDPKTKIPDWYFASLETMETTVVWDTLVERGLIIEYDKTLWKNLENYQVAITLKRESDIDYSLSFVWWDFKIIVGEQLFIEKNTGLEIPNRMIPRVFSYTIPNDFQNLTIRRWNGFYDILIDGKLFYRMGADFPSMKYPKKAFIHSLASNRKRVELGVEVREILLAGD